MRPPGCFVIQPQHIGWIAADAIDSRARQADDPSRSVEWKGRGAAAVLNLISGMEFQMRLSPAIIICTLLATTSSASAADTILASGPVYGGAGSVGGFINCRMFNAGTSTITVKTREIFTNTNVAVAFTSDTCRSALGPQKYCAFIGSISGNFAFSCRAVITAPIGKVVNARGVAEVQNTGFVVLNALPMSR
jgi:hypothetical protein